MKKAFTLIELLVVTAIFSFVVISLIVMLVSFLNVQSSESVAIEVGTQSQFLLQQIQYYVSSARLVDMAQDVATGTLTVREYSPVQDPTSIMASNGVVYLQQGVGGAWQALTSNIVFISNLSFTRHYNINSSSSAYGTDSVSFSFTMSASSTNNGQYARQFQSSDAVFAPVGKIALIQQTSTVSNNPSVTTLAATYPTNNKTSSLLIAVVAYTTPTNVGIADSAGNTWVKVLDSTYATYFARIAIFSAMNAKNSSNTVTATFSGPIYASYATLFLYEYRGASTSSSFDASSTQLQPNNSSPSSGFANPTSSVELVFGATYNGNTAEIPSAGSGFTLEASSTVSHAFVEDSTQYITGPVAATWQYTGSPSSSAVVVTFK